MATVTYLPDVPGPSTDLATLSLAPPGDAFYEVVDGRIVELSPMGAYESELAFSLALAIEQIVNELRLGKVVVEMLLRIDAARNLKRRPDLAFVAAARWPFGKRVPKGEAWDMVPDLAVEVVSQSNTAVEIVEKVRDYFQTGTRLVWVVYPSVRLVYVYTSETTMQILAEPAHLDAGNVIPGFRLSLSTLFDDEN